MEYIVVAISIIILLILVFVMIPVDPVDPADSVDPNDSDLEEHDGKIYSLCIDNKYDSDDQSKTLVIDDTTSKSCPTLIPGAEIRLKCDYDNKCADKPIPICRSYNGTGFEYTCPRCNIDEGISGWLCDESYYLGGYRPAGTIAGRTYPPGTTGDNAVQTEYNYCSRANKNSLRNCYSYTYNSNNGINANDPTTIQYGNPTKTSGVRLSSDNNNPYYIKYAGRDMSGFMGFGSSNQDLIHNINSIDDCETTCTNTTGTGVDGTTMPGCSYYIHDRDAGTCLIAYHKNGSKSSGNRKYMSGF